jgi:hypothetical protein
MERLGVLLAGSELHIGVLLERGLRYIELVYRESDTLRDALFRPRTECLSGEGTDLLSETLSCGALCFEHREQTHCFCSHVMAGVLQALQPRC